MADAPEALRRRAPSDSGLGPRGIPPTDPINYRDIVALGKLRPFAILDVREFGAAGDGQHDDAPAIQRAIGDLPTDRGGVILLPRGVYKLGAAVTIDRDDVHIIGQGPQSTLVDLAGTGSETGFDFGDGVNVRNNLSVRDLAFQASVARTGGAAIRFNKCFHVYARDLVMNGPYYGLWLADSTVAFLERMYITNTVPTNGVTVYINGGNDHYLRNIVADAPAGTQPKAGIHLAASDATWITDCDMIHQGYGLLIDPGEGDLVAWLFALNSAFDSCTNAGIHIAPTGSGLAKGLTFMGCWASTCNRGAYLVEKIDFARFVGCRFFNNEKEGVGMGGGVNVNFDDCDVSGNSTLGSASYDGMLFAAGVGSFGVRGCRIGTMTGFTDYQRYGICVADGAGDNYIIMGNDCRDNVTGDVYDGGAGANKVVDHNIG